MKKIDVAGGATAEPWFRAINPKGKVPTLVLDDGRVLTEFGAIATWLARGVPEPGLLPSHADEEPRVLSLIEFAVGTIHGQTFDRVFMPKKFELQDPVHHTLGLGRGSMRKWGETMVAQAFDIVAKRTKPTETGSTPAAKYGDKPGQAGN